MFPTERRDVFQQLARDILTLLPQMGHGPAEINGASMSNGADHQVEAGSPESLAFIRPIPDFAASAVGLDTEPELILLLQGDKSRLRHQMFVDRPELTAAFDLDIPERSQLRKCVSVATS